MANNKIGVNPRVVKRLKVLFRILAHPMKVKILETILDAENPSGICVQDIYNHRRINLGQSHASIILAELRKEGLVNTRREGKNIFYTVNKETLKGATDICNLALEGLCKP